MACDILPSSYSLLSRHAISVIACSTQEGLIGAHLCQRDRGLTHYCPVETRNHHCDSGCNEAAHVQSQAFRYRRTRLDVGQHARQLLLADLEGAQVAAELLPLLVTATHIALNHGCNNITETFSKWI